MTNVPQGINTAELGLNRSTLTRTKIPYQKELVTNIMLGNEEIKYADKEQIQSTMNSLMSIYENNFTYNTNLQQGQLTQALMNAIKQYYIKLFALQKNNQAVPQKIINLSKIFISEYEIQHRTYRNIKQHNIVEGSDAEQINYNIIEQIDKDNVIPFRPTL